MYCKTLNDLKKYFDERKITTQIQEKTDEVPFDQMFVPIGADANDKALVAQLRIIHNPAPSKEQADSYLLHTFFAYPKKVKTEALRDVARITNLLNKVLIIPGLMLSEVDGVIAFHHVNAGSRNGIDIDSVEFLLMNLVYIIDVFGTTLEGIVSGEKTYDQVLDEAQKKMAEAQQRG